MNGSNSEVWVDDVDLGPALGNQKLCGFQVLVVARHMQQRFVIFILVAKVDIESSDLIQKAVQKREKTT